MKGGKQYVKVLVLAAILAGYTTESTAAGITGNELWSAMQAEKGTLERQFAVGYIAGAVDASWILFIDCTPEGVTVEQGVDIVKKYIRQHPEERHTFAADMVLGAMIEAFPCPDE